MGEVVNLTDHAGRVRHQITVPDTPGAASALLGGAAPLVCRCGGHWFRLHDPNSDRPAQVTMTTDGVVVGHAGVPFCVDCGEAAW